MIKTKTTQEKYFLRLTFQALLTEQLWVESKAELVVCSILTEHG
jgi:hypothetical protein